MEHWWSLLRLKAVSESERYFFMGMKLIDKIKIQVSTIKELPKRVSINGFTDGCKLFYLNSMLIWIDNELKRKKLYKKKHNKDKFFVQQLANNIVVDKKLSVETQNYFIYVLWWQGEDAMPSIIHATINSIKAATNKKIVLITLENVRDYIGVPDFIWEKYKRKQMGPAHFSDYVRVALLEKYGGLWIDSTVLCTNMIPDWIYNQQLFTIRAVDKVTEELDEKYVAKGRWNTQVLGTNMINSIFFRTVRILLEQYWSRYNYMIDYLMFDDFILYAYEKYPEIKGIIDDVPVSNLKMHSLLPIMNTEYSKDIIDSLTNNTTMFKLTYKGHFVEELNGMSTFYRYILNRWGNI